MQKIIPNIWFAGEDEVNGAIELYTSLFDNSKVRHTMHYGKSSAEVSGQPEGSVLTVEFELDGYRLVGINGGSAFKPNPSVSMSVQCETEEEIDTLYKALSERGRVLMPLDKYEWSDKYVWLQDRYGVSWQLNLSPDWSKVEQRLAVALMYVGENAGRAEEAMGMYTSVFPDSSVDFVARYEKGEGVEGDEGKVKHAAFHLSGQEFMAMDSAMKEHEFNFTEGMSLLIECGTQDEIDYYWEKLTEGGEESVCGWLKDKFGLSWQIATPVLDKMIRDGDPEKSERAMKAMLTMKKLDIAELERAYRGE